MRRYPAYLPAFQPLIQVAIFTSQDDVAVTYLTRAFSLIQPEDPLRAELLVQRAQVEMKAPETLVQAYLDLLTAYRLSGNRDLVYQYVCHLFFRQPIDAALFARQVDASALSTVDAQQLRDLFATIQLSRSSGSFPKLKTNLQRVGEVCAHHGTRLIVLNYPSRTPLPEPNAIIQAFAEETATPFVDVERHFFDVVRTQRLDFGALLVKDRHPNDRGYQELARLVAEQLRAMEVDLVRGGTIVSGKDAEALKSRGGQDSGTTKNDRS